MKKKKLTAMTMAAMIMANVSPAMLTVMAAEENVGSTAAQTSEGTAAEEKQTIREAVEYTEKSEEDSNVKEINADIDATDWTAVHAEGNVSVKVNGNVSSHSVGEHGSLGIIATDGAKVNVNGDVYAEGNHARGILSAPSDEDGKQGATVHVAGTVTAKGEASRGISASGDGSVTVDKDVISDGTGISASDGTQVVVGGNVKAGSASGVLVSEASVSVRGNVSGSRGVIVDGVEYKEYTDENGDFILEAVVNTELKSAVVIDGNVHADGKQAIILYGGDAKVIVKGDVSSAENKPLKIQTAYNYGNADKEGNKTAGNSEVAIGGTLKNKENGAVLDVEVDEKGNALEIPEIVIGTVEDIGKLNVTGSYNGNWDDYESMPEINEEAKNAILSGIKYIVNTSNIKNGSISVTKIDGSKLDRDRANLYDVSKASEEIKVQIVPLRGYSVKNVSGGKATVTKNSDGSYTVLVPAGGGVDISAILEKIEAQTPASTVKRSSGSDSIYSAGSMHDAAATPGAGRTNQPNTPGSWKQNADNSWCFMDDKGEVCRNTWIVSNSRWYYADANGKAVTGWVQINGVWYYFSAAETGANPLCAMLAGTTTPDGYVLDSTGAWVK